MSIGGLIFINSTDFLDNLEKENVKQEGVLLCSAKYFELRQQFSPESHFLQGAEEWITCASMNPILKGPE